MLGKLNSDQIEEVLKHELLGRIGCHADGITYIVPISYAYDGKFVYARSKDGMKIDIMRKNPKVCFEVEAFQNMGNWKTVIIWGEFREINAVEERKHALQMLQNRHLPLISSETTHISTEWPFQPADINTIEGVVFSISVNEKTGRFEIHGGVDEVSQPFL